MKVGTLEFAPASEAKGLVAETTLGAIEAAQLEGVFAATIDPELADTAACCERYNISLEMSANCVIVEAKRTDRTWYAACMVLATAKADVNGVVRRALKARKTSFAPMDTALALTRMEYGGINPIGLPADWPVLVDSNVAAQEWVVIGSGLRKSKLLVPGALLAGLPTAVVLDLAKA